MSTAVPRIVLIGGTGRSGTNVTKEIFSRHPEVATLPFEHRFVIDPDGIVDFYQSYSGAWSPFMADKKLRRFERYMTSLAHEPGIQRIIGNIVRKFNRDGKKLSPRSYHGWNLDEHFPGYSEELSVMMGKLREFSFPGCWPGMDSYTRNAHLSYGRPLSKPELAQILGAFLNNVLASLLEKRGKSVFVEDNTWNILFAQELHELMPQAKMLHIVRDPRDVVCSFLKQRWCPSSLTQATAYYQGIASRWLEIKKGLAPGFCMEIKLEDIVAQPEPVLRNICEFLSLPFAPELLSVDLSKSHSGRWKKELDEASQRELESLLGVSLEAMGYQS
ncbi:MAG: hypothetical protein A2X49_01050 [Lentisphaerae bacterium GWF2_52_8]|nr:MAG: hypothetical protein A2X49_01050 [Lentisphaerae bacterium GWF2_52_8]